jgi:uncharacterized membrane protein
MVAATPAVRQLELAAAAEQAPRRSRVDSVDLLRGLVMIVMALDHARDYFHHDALLYDPTDLARTTPLLFFTRWITHFCAPAFVLLAGTGAFLYGSRGRPRSAVARFLATRGVWLVLIEVTVVRFGWFFNFDYRMLFLQVIWAIGCSMIVLAGLIHLPRWAILLFGAGMIGTHNLFDGIGPAPFTSVAAGPAAITPAGWAWSMLHVPNPPFLYPLVPWIGVMAVGYVLGSVMLLEGVRRRRVLLGWGLALTVAFVVLRALNGYGDPSRWSAQPSPVYTLLSFLNTTKYPPSLDYLLMTLGPSLVFLALVDRASGPLVRFVVTYGRVPFFYYVLHIYVIHALVLLVAAASGDPLGPFLTLSLFFPATWGFGLGTVYAVWAGVVLALYPACRWFAALKARRADPWLSYL